MQKKQLFLTVYPSAQWVKPAKLTYPIPTLLLGALWVALTYTTKQELFFDDMLPVKISISIL